MIGLAMMLAATDDPLSGNGLYDQCTGTSSQQLLCSAYIVGVTEGVIVRESIRGTAATLCVPDGVLRGQVIDVAKNYLRDHPENRQRSANDLVYLSLRQAFPCRKR